MTSNGRKWLIRVVWLVLATPGLIQLGMLLYAMFARFAYPYDLEWMEGGLLGHSQRMLDGDGIYVAPSVDFIPYLYTPLYPGIVAVLGAMFGVSYQLGRGISILSVIGVVVLMTLAIRRDCEPAEGDDDRFSAWTGAAVAAGFFSATYPWLEGWYDLVRADSMFLFMILGGLYALRVWAREGTGWRGHGRVAIAAAILGLSFFCKQTGVMYVAVGGAMLLVLNWRRVPVYVGVSGAIGLGGTALLNSATGGWFWTYIYEVHQVHDFNMDRFYASFENILWHFPAMTIVIALGLVAVGATAAAKRKMPRSAKGLLLWSYVFAASCVVGAVGWGTQWAHFNAYMPAMMTGALACGAALCALIGCAREWLDGERATWAPTAIGMAVAAALGAQLIMAWWTPQKFVPTDRDRDAGDQLIQRIMAVDGDVFIPYHPWYGHLAGKRLYTHRMGMLDMTYGGKWKVTGWQDSIRNKRFAAVILDNHGPRTEFRNLRRHYRIEEDLPGTMKPRMYTGAQAIPKALWVPAVPEKPPEGATLLFDFEDGTLKGWDIQGTAWGRAPVTAPLARQGAVSKYQGRFFIDSMHGTDKTKGTLTSPAFEIDGKRITFRLSGGKDESILRVELRIDGKAVRTASNDMSTEAMQRKEWDVSEFEGEEAQIVLIDDSDASWGHLNADEFLLWEH